MTIVSWVLLGVSSTALVFALAALAIDEIKRALDTRGPDGEQ